MNNTPQTLATAVIGLFHPSRPENRVIFRQVPAWVLECAALRLREEDGKARRQANTCGNALLKLLQKGSVADSKLRQHLKKHLVLIDSAVPFGWAGALTTAPNFIPTVASL